MSDASPATSDNLFRLLAAGFLALIIATWPLWTPQTGFPQVPLMEVAGHVHAAVEWMLLFMLLGLQGLLLIAPRFRYRQVATLFTVICTLGLVCIDQHRLQPWVWQFLLIALVLTVADAPTSYRAWRWIVIGIYVWSAWSKFDYGFTQQHGPFLLDGLLKSLGLKVGTQFWPATVRSIASAAIPCIELTIAISLAWPRTRRKAVYAAAIMHVSLLMALGPWGHDHLPGVLFWNVFFLFQNALVFRSDPVQLSPLSSTTVDASSLSPSTLWGNRFAWGVVGLAMIWPLSESFGLCDHWPAWAVYATRPERVVVSIRTSEQLLLPTTMQSYLGKELISDDWTPVRIDLWSLKSVRCPIYPQDRFQVGVALGLAEEFHLTTLRIVIESPADRWTGQRVIREYEGLDTIHKLADSYRLGASPRQQFD